MVIKEIEMEMFIILVMSFIGLLLVWVFLSGFVGPVLGFWVPLVTITLYKLSPGVGLWILIIWVTCSTVLLLVMRYKQGAEEYLSNMNDLRYSVGGPGCSIDIETVVWTFFLPGRIMLKLLWLERAPNARYDKTVPLSLGRCNRYFE